MSQKDPAALRDKEEQVAQNRAELLRVPYVDVRQDGATAFLPDLLSVQDMEKLQVVPLRGNVSQLLFGFTLNTPQASLNEVKSRLPEYTVSFAFISKSGFDALYEQYYEHEHRNDPKPPTPEEVAEQLTQKILNVNEQISQGAEINLFDQQFADTSQSELFTFIVQQGFLLGASDIHIEPEGDGARLRFRIDGRLLVVGHLEQNRYKVLLNDLQMRARIRWNADYPQTGSTRETLINQDKQNVEVNMRIETVPTLHGSDIVIRIFNMDEAFLNLNNIGLKDSQQHKINTIISQPYGLVLMVGPTGSGKSSTLYSMLNELNTTEVKIVTLEDPIEYEISGITQIPVDTDNQDDTFADKLRAVLREDPDIIMIGEIRDSETARTALQASLTGHLVLSTFHASSGAAAVSRMLDMIDFNPLLASAFRLVMSQRLVRRLCEHCKQPYTPDEDTARIIVQELQGSDYQPPELTLYQPVGCDQCHQIGYSGRVIIVEQFEVTDRVARAIAENNQISVRELRDLAAQDGMETMLQDGIQKALEGQTSMAEVLRVVELQ